MSCSLKLRRLLLSSEQSLCSMREGWKVQKLTNVCSMIADGDWIESRHQSDSGIRLLQTGNIGNGFFKAKDDKPHFISESTFNELGCTEIFAGDCLVSRLPDPIGRACIVPDIDSRMITAVDCSIIRFNGDIIPKFFIYYSQSEQYRQSINNNTTGSTRKRISRKNLEAVQILLPSLSEQERIVAELDCLSSVIEKQKEQLKELDNLAQSIFYTMFGDPISNNFGWEVKKFEDCYKLASGQGLSAKDIVMGDYPVYGGNGIVGYHQEYNLAGDNIVIGRVGALCGNVRNVLGKAFITDNAFILTKKITNVNTYLLYLLRLHNLRQYAREAMQPVVSNSGLKNINIIIPPLGIQQEFASKIEAIEKQKELIKQSIAETVTLFNSQMDYYFN